jgi:uroporphyrinogen-III synthase
MRLLVTRPELDGEQTAAQLRARGHEVSVAALIAIESIPDADLGAGPWTGIIMTSANAARAVEGHPRLPELQSLPVYAVGRRTAEAAHRAGFAEIVSADGDADDIIRLVAARSGGSGVLLYLAGADRAKDVAGALAGKGVTVETAVVYRAAELGAFPASVRTALLEGRLDGVLHYSRRSAEIYLNAARRAGLLDSALRPSHYCLSKQVAEPLLAAGAPKVVIASRPEEATMMALIAP